MKKVIRTRKRAILSILCLWTCFFGVARAADTGLKTTGTIVSSGSWTNFTTTYLNTSNNSRAWISASSSYGVCAAYGFSIPSGATINGIEVEMEGRAAVASTVNYGVSISWNNGSSWVSEKTDSYTSSTDATDTCGGSSDTWGRSWTDTELSDANFQLRVRKISGLFNLEIDFIQVRVYYTELLPIQLSSFTAQFLPGTQRVVLRWTTLSETNNYGFEVQRRREGEPEFATLPQSFIPGHGTTLEEHHYSFTDSMVPQGIWHYRLRQIDLDGTQHYTESAQVEVTTDVAGHSTPAEFCLSQNYPNPFNPSTVIGFNLPKAGYVSLVVFDLLGREVETLIHGNLPAGSHSSVWTPKGIAGGAYIYRLKVQGIVMLRKLMLLR